MDPKILFVRVDWNDNNNAPARIITTPLLLNLSNHFTINTLILKNNISEEEMSVINISSTDVILFHFYDLNALNFSILHGSGKKLVCFICDIYNLDYIYKLDNLNITFVVPTDLHAKILCPLINSRIEVIPEPIDSIALPKNGLSEIPLKNNYNICWFGYPEAYYKSLSKIMKTLNNNEVFEKNEFNIITRKDEILSEEFEHFTFDINNFYSICSNFNYSILSHYSFDMSLNTFCKSPNKLITSLVRGLVPFFSNTPNYKLLSDEYNLNNLIFNNSEELFELIKMRKSIDFYHKYSLRDVSIHLQEKLSTEKISALFVKKVLNC